MGYIYGRYGYSINIIRFNMKRLSRLDIIYSLLLLAVGMVVGWFIRGGCNMDLSEEGQYGGSNGGQNKRAEYEINIDQTHAYIKTIGTGEIQKTKHKELNDWFINDNL